MQITNKMSVISTLFSSFQTLPMKRKTAVNSPSTNWELTPQGIELQAPKP